MHLNRSKPSDASLVASDSLEKKRGEKRQRASDAHVVMNDASYDFGQASAFGRRSRRRDENA